MNSKNIKTEQQLPRLFTIVLYGIFFISGITALIYEITWMRIISRILGSTTLAGTLILAAFFSGLALGAWLLGKFVDRYGKALLVYCCIEVSLGVYAFYSVTIFEWFDSLSWFLPSSGGSNFLTTAMQFVVLWLLLLPPTILMGGTLPVVSRFMVKRLDKTGLFVGRLYAYNTLGAVLGTALAAFYLISMG